MIRHGYLSCVAILFAGFASIPVNLRAQAPVAEAVQLRTADGVQLAITYYASNVRAGTPRAKQVTPVVMLHDHKDTRGIFGQLATQLQRPPDNERDRPPFAVVTVDLRGHGDSTKQIFPDGTQQILDAARISKADVYSMSALDMEEVRRFLVTKNDEGALNLNKLCLIGSGMGANVAANWAVEDWRVPPLAIGKQGQDVKALVMISPQWSFLGLSMQGPMRLRTLKQQAWMLIYGAEDPEAITNIRRIEKQLKPFHPETDSGGARRRSDLVVLAVPSKLQGDSLVTKLGETVNDRIVEFLVENVASQSLPWATRRARLP